MGEPITWKGTVTGRANEVDGIAAMQIPVVGPKAAATVIVEGKKFGDEWGVTLLEIRPKNGDEKLSLTADLAMHEAELRHRNLIRMRPSQLLLKLLHLQPK